MTRTTAELREIVAEKLRVKAVDLDLSAEDAAKIDRHIGETTDFLREAGLVWWADNAIPNAAVLPMTLIVSAWAATDFGKAGQGYEAGFIEGRGLLATLKPSADIQTVCAEYF